MLKLVADGRTNRLIGEDLGLSALTVKSHLARISRKLGTGDRAELVAISIRGGVLVLTCVYRPPSARGRTAPPARPARKRRRRRLPLTSCDLR